MRTLEEQHKLLEELLSEARKRKSAGERVTKDMNDVRCKRDDEQYHKQ